MTAKTRRALLLAASLMLAGAAARAQTSDPIADLLSGAQPAPAEENGPVLPLSRAVSGADQAQFRQALEAARHGDVNRARTAISQITDTVARNTAEWVLADSNGESLGFSELDQVSRDLAAWPHANRRAAAAEKLLESAGKSPQQILAWFSGREPQTAHGAMALAAAYRLSGQPQNATALIRNWWRDKSFDAEAQRAMLSRFGDVLTQDDHVRRVDVLLYGTQTGAARELLPLLPADQQAAALARLALRADAGNANELAGALPASVAQSPGVIFERAAYLRRHGLDELALSLVRGFPHETVTPDQADRVWSERRHLILAALRTGDVKGAYASAADTGLTQGQDAAEAEFNAGWIALTRLKDAPSAAGHFAAIAKVATSPITKARAYYWQGRAAEAAHDDAAAQGFYRQGAQYETTFYGLLSAEKAGLPLTLVSDPVITAADRARFEAQEPVAGARLLLETGHKDLFRTFALNLAKHMTSATDEALLIDMVRGYGEQFLSMQVARDAAQRGFILPGRAYPTMTPPSATGAPEPALVLAITRQESSFDPYARSGPGARGMMQLMPTTAAIMARKIGVSYSTERLNDADYNMRLGSHYLGQLVDQFSGSYVMAAAGYNAGPGRPAQWVSYCGDPRGGTTDPIDFIECIPFSQTRDYVMRVMENLEVYKAKMAGGSMPLTITADLKRGGYGAPVAPVALQAVAANTEAAKLQ